jgi:hypothetical protein
VLVLKAELSANIIRSFRYATSQLYRVQSQYTGRDIKRALVGMPSDLNEVYRRIICRHDSGTAYRAYMRKALLWLSFTNRPLHLEELCEAIVIEEGDVDLDEYSRLHDPLMLLRLGQGLFELDKRSGCVTLSHSSVKTFLTSAHIRTTDAADFALDEVESDNTIVRACLTYLRFNVFVSGSRVRSDPSTVSTQSGHRFVNPKELHRETYNVVEISQLDSLFPDYPLVAYAAENWPLHVHDGGKYVKQEIQSFMLTRNKPNGGNYAFWIRHIAGDLPLEIILRTSPIYYRAPICSHHLNASTESRATWRTLRLYGPSSSMLSKTTQYRQTAYRSRREPFRTRWVRHWWRVLCFLLGKAERVGRCYRAYD